MYFAASPSHTPSARICNIHGSPSRRHSTYTVGYVVDPRASQALTTVTTCTCRSPVLTISPLPGTSPLPGISPLLPILPLPGVSPLSASFAVANVQNVRHRGSPSPIISTLVLATPSVNPLVALDSGLCYYKLRYDVSKDPSTVRVSRPLASNVHITHEEKRSLVVEGVPHLPRFRIVLDHHVLTSFIEFEGLLTVEDLLRQLHSYLHKRVSSGEMHNLKGDWDLHQTAIKTRTKRCEAAFDRRAEWGQGMKRVDVLGKGCMFHGVYLDAHVGDYLTLHVVLGK